MNASDIATISLVLLLGVVSTIDKHYQEIRKLELMHSMNAVTEAVKVAIGLAPIREPIKDKRRFLKVKIKSLAAEARIIRLEEARAVGTLREELHNHRVLDVRSECRATHIAYAFIRGKRFDQVEQLPREIPHLWWYRQKPVFCRALKMILKYGNTEGMSADEVTGEFIDWLISAENMPPMPWLEFVP